MPSRTHAATLIAEGRFDEAFKELNALSHEQPEPPGVERMRGFIYYQLSELSKAEQVLKHALSQDSQDVESAQLLGTTLFRLGRSRDAIPILEAIHASRSNEPGDPNYILSLCYMDADRYDDARERIAADYGLQADSPSAHLLTARLLLRREYVLAAGDEASKALALNPTLPLAHELLGEVQLAQSNISAAIVSFKEERAVNPLYGGSYERLGDAYFRAGEYELSRQSLNQAVLLEPNTTGPYILLGKVFLQQRNPVMAIQYLKRASHMDPSNYITHLLLGQAYHASGHTQDASREIHMMEQLRFTSH